MLLQDLYTNFLDLDDAQKLEFIQDYCARRNVDLRETAVVKVPVKKERGKGRTDKKITVSKDQLALLKQLGLC